MSPDEALALIQSLKRSGVELRQRGRALNIARGADQVGEPLRLVISRNWEQVASAVSAQRQTERLIARASRRRLAA